MLHDFIFYHSTDMVGCSILFPLFSSTNLNAASSAYRIINWKKKMLHKYTRWSSNAFFFFFFRKTNKARVHSRNWVFFNGALLSSIKIRPTTISSPFVSLNKRHFFWKCHGSFHRLAYRTWNSTRRVTFPILRSN